jgi:HPt (histidine-containing phosphotransfer) domain-containing protein
MRSNPIQLVWCLAEKNRQRGTAATTAEGLTGIPQIGLPLAQAKGRLCDELFETVQGRRAHSGDGGLVDACLRETRQHTESVAVITRSAFRSWMPRWRAHEKHLAADGGVAKPIRTTLLTKLAAIAGKLPQKMPAAVEIAPRTPDGGSKGVLDFEKLQTLDAVLPATEATAFVELYLTDAETHLVAIADATKRMDLNAIGRSAHVLVSTAGNVGAIAVSLSARRLMEACRANDRASVETGVGGLQVAHCAASDALRAWLAARSAETQTAERA